jgi:hypothetical protein
MERAFKLLSDPWVQQDELLPLLRSYRENAVIYGDVYAG